MKLAKFAIAGLALAASVGANAEWVSGGVSGTEGELVLTVWNPNTNTSFTQDLGVGSSSFLGSTAAAQNFTLSQEGLDFIGAASDASDIRWNVFGVNTNINAGGLSSYGYYFTSNTQPFMNDLSISPFLSQLQQVNAYEGVLGTADAGTTDDPVFFLSGAITYAGFAPVWGQAYRGLGLTFGSQDNVAGDGEQLSAWNLGRTQFEPYPITQTNIGGTAAFWQMDLSSGSLQYSAVPVPAAVWLFGSALLGLAGAIRRRKAVRAA